MKSRRVEILSATVVLFVSASPVIAALTLGDGGVHNIDYEVNEEIRVDFELPGLGTTVNILEGGSITSAYLKGFEESVINILGGYVEYLSATGSSQVSVSEGMVADFHAYQASQVSVSGGSMEELYARESSQVDVSGGSMLSLAAFDSSEVSVSGGSIEDIAAIESSRVSISGGSMGWLKVTDNSQISVSGGLFGEGLRLGGNTVLTMEGWDFAVDGTDVGYIELTSILGLRYYREPYRRLTGTLLNGDPLDVNFRIGEAGRIILVPEPATLLLLGLGGLVAVRRRRQA